MLTMTRDPRTETYRDVEKLIYRTCYDFARRYGGDIDELVSTGNEAYACAYNSYDPSRNALFSTWVRTQVWYALMNERKARYRIRERCAGDDTETWARNESEFDMDEFAIGLSPDSQHILGLLQTPPAALADVATAKGDHGINWRSTLKSYLRAAGWTHARVAESFAEIAQALQE